MKCGADETHMHYLHCTVTDMLNFRETRLHILNQQLKKLNTYDGLRIFIVEILRNGIQNSSLDKHHCMSDKYITDALKDQRAIGNDMLERGFVSIQ